MRCKTCEYRLWNLPTRVCPECGTAFLPSDHEFIPNTVQFCCPRCDASYYGTGEKGHLVPTRFVCSGCNHPIDMDEMILRPTAGVEEEQMYVERTPWLERSKRGFFRAWLPMIGMALVHPIRLGESIPDPSSRGQAWWFAILTGTAFLLCGAGAIAAIVVLQMVMASRTGAAGPWLMSAARTLAIVFLCVSAGMAVFVLVWGLVTHGLLLATGDTERPLGRTYEALCYSTGANVATAIPCVGCYVGWIWWFVSALLVVKAAQGVHGWRAALAVLTFPAVGLFVFIVFYGLLMTSMVTGIGPFGGMAMNPQSETQLVLESVITCSRDNNGLGPAHAVELVSEDYLDPTDMFSKWTATGTAAVMVAGVTLDQLDAMVEPGRSNVVRAAAKALPQNTIAHRVGDFVFVYHGIDVNTCDPRLWLVILSPDPDVNAGLPPLGGRVLVGTCNGSTGGYAGNFFPAALVAQNQVRAQFGLAPLPDPSTVTSKNPAVAEP